MAFTHLLLSTHILAVERLRWSTRARQGVVPREWRLCRFCVASERFEVEDAVHALLRCESHPRLVELREDWWSRPIMTSAREKFLGGLTEGRDILRMLMRRPELHDTMGWYIYHVLNVFGSVAMYEPPAAVM